MKYKVIHIPTGQTAEAMYPDIPHAVDPQGRLVWWSNDQGWVRDGQPQDWHIELLVDHAMVAEAAAITALTRFAAMRPRPPWVTQEQAAIMMHKSIPTVRARIKEGHLKLNADKHITTESIDAYLASHPVEEPNEQ